MISNEAEVKCPFNDMYACQAAISEREIRAVSRSDVVVNLHDFVFQQ